MNDHHGQIVKETVHIRNNYLLLFYLFIIIFYVNKLIWLYHMSNMSYWLVFEVQNRLIKMYIKSDGYQKCILWIEWWTKCLSTVQINTVSNINEWHIDNCLTFCFEFCFVACMLLLAGQPRVCSLMINKVCYGVKVDTGRYSAVRRGWKPSILGWVILSLPLAERCRHWGVMDVAVLWCWLPIHN